MHMIGSSLCFWISTIVREILLALTIYANSVYGNRNETETETETYSETGKYYNVLCTIFNKHVIYTYIYLHSIHKLNFKKMLIFYIFKRLISILLKILAQHAVCHLLVTNVIAKNSTSKKIYNQ